jgi:macrolide-specific efflux system membrane fusion protein
MSNCTLFILSLALAGQPFDSQYGSSPDEDTVLVKNCLVSQIDHVQLPAQKAGTLTELSVEEGDLVKQGDVLGTIDETETMIRRKAAKFRLDVAHEKSTNDSMVKLQDKIIELQKAEYEQSLAINKRSRGTISESELRLNRVRYEKAVLDAVVERMNFTIAGLEEKVAEAEVEAVDHEMERRTLRAPFDGIVSQIYRQESEWVREGDPVLYLIRMDRLRVEGFVNADQVAPYQIAGSQVEITVDLVGTTVAELTGTIDFVSPTVESNGDYRVWAEVDNEAQSGSYPWLLRPGVEADMVIHKRS